MKRITLTLPHRATRSLAQVAGMTADDWEAVYLAHQGFLAQVNLIVARVEEREAKRRAVENMNA